MQTSEPQSEDQYVVETVSPPRQLLGLFHENLSGGSDATSFLKVLSQSELA